jgi:hypothetical protein
MMTLVEKLDRLPPCIVRVMAKHNNRMITDPELMRRTGWGRRKLMAVYKSASWDGIKVGDVDNFLKACGMSWSSQRRQRWLLQLAIKNGGIHKMQHLKTDTGWRGNQLRLHLMRIEKLLS